ncbi:hypothetical protein MMC22_010916 [Lobaria immixta]|nr:hypothetical protein [Lobaria immixta]
MPPTTRSMTARGVVAPKEYAVRQKKAKKPQPEPDPNLTKHGQIGFDRKRLQIGGALELDAAKPPTLANDVLKIFRKKEFVFDNETPPAEWDEAYENMKPAFRLVSRWMTDPIFESFWGTLVHNFAGEAVSEHPERQVNWEIQWYGWYPHRRYANYVDVFDFIPHQFRFQPISHAWAETRSQSNAFALYPQFASVTFLHEDFFHLSYTDFPKATKSQQLRFLYFLAVTIAHEMAHLLWQHNWAKNECNKFLGTEKVLDWEPYFVHEDFAPRAPSGLPHNELGIVWEWFMFGGRIQPLNQSLSPFVPDGLVILPMDMVRHTYFWDPQCRIAPLRTSWISDQFSEAWWHRKGKRAALARQPRRPGLAPDRATVNRTIDSSVFQENEYDIGGEAQRVAEHVVGGSPGGRAVQHMNDTWVLTGVVRSLWVTVYI